MSSRGLKKLIFIIIGVVFVAGLIGIVVSNTSQPSMQRQQPQSPVVQQQILKLPIGDEIVVSGLVIKDSLDLNFGLPIADGLERFLLKANNQEIKIVYHYGEWPRCVNNEASLTGGRLKKGDEVDVFGKVTGSNEISTCDSEDYYIIPTSGAGNATDTSNGSTALTTGWQTYRNEQYGFEIRHPSTWSTVSVSSTFSLSGQVIRFNFNSNGKDGFLDVLPNGGPKFSLGPAPTTEEINIGGREVIEEVGRGVKGGEDIFIIALGVFDNPPAQWGTCNTPYEPCHGFVAEAPDEETFDILKQVLSTFKFIE